MRASLLSIACLALLTQSAHAGPLSPNGAPDEGQYFFNRPGATESEVTVDTARCNGFAGQVFVQPPARGGALGGMLGALGVTRPRRALFDDCMIALGYSRYQTTDENERAFTRRMSAMGPEERAAIAGGDPPPEGALARTWTNSYWIATPSDPDSPQSRRISPAVDDNPPAMSMTQLLVGVPVAEHLSELDEDAVVALGADQALVLVTIRRGGVGNARSRVDFGPVQSWRGDNRNPRSGGRRRFEAELGPREALDGSPRSFAFVIPAGAYGLAIARGGPETTEFCLGTIGFIAEPGDVLHLGDYLVVASAPPGPYAPPAPFGIRVDPGSLESGRSRLARMPDLAARLRLVEYFNGAQWPCQVQREPGAYAPVYGFDLPGAPWIADLTAAQD
jgi:hypothetical protein